MNTITILLGGNIGNTQQFILDAERLLVEQLGPIQLSSSIYKSEPWGFLSSQWFLNKTIVIQSELQALQVLGICQEIENSLGRKRGNTIGYESRPIDIDILFFNNDIINEPTLIIPHPKLHLRRFTLLPLHEIMHDFVHPVLKETIVEIINECEDNGVCRKQ